MALRGLDRLEPVDRETTAGAVASQLRERIVDGTFAPGSRLGEVQLATRLGVGRGSVREALQRLVQEGLLENRRNHGVFVTVLDDRDVADVYLARRAVEREAVRLLLAQPDREAVFGELENLVSAMGSAAEGGDWERLADADLRFHELIVRSSGSARLRRMFGTLLVEARMCLARLKSAYPVHERLVREHRDLLGAMRDGNERAALALVDAHLGRAVEDLTGAKVPDAASGTGSEGR